MVERARQRRRLARLGSVAIGIAALGAGAWFGADAYRKGWRFDELRSFARETLPSGGHTLASAEAREPVVSPGVVAGADTFDSSLITDTSLASRASLAADTSSHAAPMPVVATPVDTAPAPAAPATVLAPVIAEGRTELGDSVYAVREGPTVTVHFDTFMSRTRRRDKFDRIVRETLPRVYGAPADSLLASVPVGQIAQGRDLLAELPDSGISFELADGSTLALWPRTRPGRDGPLVVAYRATITR